MNTTTEQAITPGAVVRPTEGRKDHWTVYAHGDPSQNPPIVGVVWFDRHNGELYRYAGSDDATPPFGSDSTLLDAAKALTLARGFAWDGRLSAPAELTDNGDALGEMLAEFRHAFPRANTAMVAGFMIGRMRTPTCSPLAAMSSAALGQDPGRYTELAAKYRGRAEFIITMAEQDPYKAALEHTIKALTKILLESEDDASQLEAARGLALAHSHLTGDQAAALGFPDH